MGASGWRRSEQPQQSAHTLGVGLQAHLLPNDFGEFLLVLQNGPDEERLQGVPGDGRHVLGG